MRLIDADAIIYHGEYNDIVFKSSIDLVPTIEAEPIRHGRWIEIEGQNLPVMKCSVCKRKKTGTKRRYCPHCGAKMDSKEAMYDG